MGGIGAHGGVREGVGVGGVGAWVEGERVWGERKLGFSLFFFFS
ncbi:MAG: hypothetical protein ACKESB_03400 [Candidatus Hodgkinia cicadicola]